MANTLQLKNDIKKLKLGLKSKGLSASIKDKLKTQLTKVENELKSAQAGAPPRKVSTTKSTKDALDSLKQLIKKKGYGVYQNAGVDLKKDAQEGALATGRRVSKGLKGNQYGDKASSKGHVYYEYRANRLDVKQPKGKQKYPKLEKGGYMAKGGSIEKLKIKYKLSPSTLNLQLGRYGNYNYANRRVKNWNVDDFKSYVWDYSTDDFEISGTSDKSSLLLKEIFVNGKLPVKNGELIPTGANNDEYYKKYKSSSSVMYDVWAEIIKQNNLTPSDDNEIIKEPKPKLTKSEEKELKDFEELRENTPFDIWISKDSPATSEMYERNRELTNKKNLILDHEGKLEKGGYMAKGGKIENQYEGRTASDIWKNLYGSQRYEFLLDHEDVILGLKEAKELPQFFNGDQKRLEWNKLDKDVKKAFEQHVMWGEYEKGGKLIGKQKNLDVNENGKLDAEDFKMLRKQRMAEGGITEKEVVDSNAQMVLSQIKAVKHHADELSQVVSRNSDIEAWVVAKIERASTDLSDITHYLDGQHEKMSMGGSVYHHAHKMDKK